MTAREVGRVAALWRYPVKSMAGEQLQRADVSWHGLAGDRRWAFVREGMVESGFPWLTMRESAALGGYRPSFLEPERPDRSRTRVRTPSGAALDVTSPELAAELGFGARVIRQDRGVFDTMPLSLLTTQSVASLGALVGTPLDPLRFRPNLLVECTDPRGFQEDEWVGAVLRVGAMRMRVDKRDGRCVMINIDPSTLAKDAAVLRAVARARDNCFGVYGSTVEPGPVQVGDAVAIEH